MTQTRSLFSSYRNSKKEEQEEEIRQETIRQLDLLAKTFPSPQDETDTSSLPTFESPQCLSLADVCGMGQFGVVVEVAAMFLTPQVLQNKGRSVSAPPQSTEAKSIKPNELTEMRKHLIPMSPITPRRRSSSVLRMEAATLSQLAALDVIEDGGDDEKQPQTPQDPLNEAKQKLQTNCVSPEGTSRYVVKRIRQDLYPAKKLQAVVDLAKEGKWLALPQLRNHPNICTLHAYVSMPGKLDYMLVLEKLGKTLHDVIETEWKLADPSYASSYAKKSILSHYENSFANFWNPLLLSAADEGSEGTNTNKTSRGEAYTAQSLLLDRIWALLDIARGMQCLHQHHILMRDLKTENLAYAASTGTEERKVLKLFDFGLARACYAPIQDEGMIGTLKIMAPEVIQGTPFGLQADVYSFAITAVEVFSCQDSHLGVDVATHIQRVVAKSRPPRPAGMPEVIWKLIEKCWEQDPEKRPGFDEVFLVLDEFAKSLPGVPLTGIDAASDSLSMNGINSKGVSSNLRNERLTDESPTDGAPKSVEITVGL